MILSARRSPTRSAWQSIFLAVPTDVKAVTARGSGATKERT